MFLALDEKKYYATVRMSPEDRNTDLYSMHAIKRTLPLHRALSQG
jgi:hypothetical protein